MRINFFVKLTNLLDRQLAYEPLVKMLLFQWLTVEAEQCNQQCNECEFPANDIFELGEHIYEFHTQKAHGKFACNFCGERFWIKDDLMLHRKTFHVE